MPGYSKLLSVCVSSVTVGLTVCFMDAYMLWVIRNHCEELTTIKFRLAEAVRKNDQRKMNRYCAAMNTRQAEVRDMKCLALFKLKRLFIAKYA